MQVIFPSDSADSGLFCQILINVVRHLRDADNIIVLSDTGTILQQGSFQTLNLQDGYVQNLLLNSDTNESSSKSPSAATEEIERNDHVAKVKITEQDQDLLRKTGDSTLYKYYLKSVGWKDGISILLLSIGAQFCVYFPREYFLPYWFP
jgi:ATP-binding cassette subfamily C (CFTR/MRP) protein 1